VDTFFAVQGGELISAASAVPAPEDAGVVVLMDEGTFAFDTEGRCTSRYRTTYRILTAAGMEQWAQMAAGWSPWYEERPSFRARVVTPDGGEHLLAQETIAEGPMADDSSQTFSDRRILRAPLPALAVGAVVEREIVLREKVPFFIAGNVNKFYFGQSVRTLNSRLVLEAPEHLPLRYAVRLLPGVAGVKTTANGRTRISFESGAIEPLKPAEPGVPGDVPRWPSVTFSTGRSWQEVAKRYGEIVDGRINGADLSALVRETVGDATDRRLIAARLLERMRKEIRYAGIEFGEASIVPHTPLETLQRKYGDCKDQAALLVSMLRTAGVPAYLALLRNGAGEDVEPDLPGLGHFNHAIVYLPGTPALWVDPTEKLRPAGELPLYDQGRRALIAGAPGTTTLTVTPTASSQDNRQVEQREFVLSELGKCRVTETTRLSGSIAAGYRSEYSQKGDKKLRKELEEYIRAAYLAERLAKVEMSGLADPEEPFRFALQIEEAKRGFTDESNAVAAIVYTSLAERLPQELTGPDPVNRQNEYQLREPYVYEMHYRIHPPPGFKARQLPDSGITWLGPMQLSKRFSLEEDGSVTGILRFDTVKNRFSPAEVETVRKGVRELQNEKPLFVYFELTGQALLAAGRGREALAEFKKLCSLHPGEALHHIQLANALLKLGLTGAARKEAEQAVKLEPNSAVAHRTLGFILQHDAVGRLRRKGFDRDRALEEYRRAKLLDPVDFLARGDLAILLEHDGDGKRYSIKADLEGAIKEYRELRTGLKQTGLDDNLLVCLLRTGRWQEIKELVLSEASGGTHTSYLLVAIAGEQGAAAAIEEAKRRISDPETRRSDLEKAAARLLVVRRYRDAAELLDEAAKGATNAVSLSARSKLLKEVRPFEEASLSLAQETPVNPFKRMLLAIFLPESPRYSLFSQFASYIREEMEREKVDLRQPLESIYKKASAAAADLPVEVVLDLALSSMEFHPEGSDATGYRVDAVASSLAGAREFRFYVTNEDGQYRLVAADTQPGVVGLEVLRRVEAGDFKGAKTWLDWVRDEATPARGDDPWSGNPFTLAWSKESAADPERMRLAAAVLLSTLDTKTTLPLLSKGGELPESEARLAAEISLSRVFLAQKRYSEFLAQGEKLAKRYPLSLDLFLSRIAALESLGRREEVRALTEERLRTLPKDPTALRIVARSAEQVGDFALAAKWYKRIVEEGGAVAGDYNNLAWLGLFSSSVPAESLAFAERSVAQSNKANPSFLHTLSALYAETGRAAEARETVLQALELDDRKEIAPEYWYVFGRIAEQYGEIEAAREAYGRVAKPGETATLADSTYALARKRLDLGK